MMRRRLPAVALATALLLLLGLAAHPRRRRLGGCVPLDTNPILLLPGWGSGVPMWADNLPQLAQARPVWAFDGLGDAGMSAQTAPLEPSADESGWIEETLTGLAIPAAHVIGHSFDGTLAMNFTIHHPGRVASLTLLEPVRIFSGLSAGIVLSSVLSQLPFLLQSWRDAALAYIGGAEVDEVGAGPVPRMIAADTEHCQARRTVPKMPDDAQLAALAMPVAVHLGEDSTVTQPRKAQRRLREALPEVTVTMWPGTGYSLPMDKSAEVNRAILEWIAAR